MKRRIQSVAVVHNIPTPYRVHFFNALAAVVADAGASFVVHFLARGHADRRYWSGCEEAVRFDAKWYSDQGVTLGRKEWHWNPDLIAHLRLECPEVLLVCGPWDSLTAAAVSLGRYGRTRVGWLEGNSHTVGRGGWAGRKFKRSCLRGYSLLLAPGEEGRRYVRQFCSEATPIVNLPNVVERVRFQQEEEAAAQSVRARLGIEPWEKHAIWPARLIADKGIIEFLSSFGPEDFAGWRVSLIGDGYLKERVEELIDRKGLTQIVRLLGSLPYEEMPGLYAAADLFLLPSLRDLNPLSVVEALHARLPLLLSMRAGNSREALAEANGWGFDPLNESDKRATVRRALSSSRAELREMGSRSRELGERGWASEVVAGEVWGAVESVVGTEGGHW